MKNTSATQDRTQEFPEKVSGLAFRFVLTMGIVNLFADTTYEGGASINGPFLGSLGVKAAAISIIAGVGEFLGYSLRAVSGYIRTGSARVVLWRCHTSTAYSISLNTKT
jgi:hypothetical protein